MSVQFTGYLRHDWFEWYLDYAGARYYRRFQGRFTTADEALLDQTPGDPQSWNLYSYVRNNPLVNVDPTGRYCVNLDNGTQGDDGKGTPCASAQLGTTHGVAVGVGRDEANLNMLQGIGERLSSPHQWASLGSGAGQGAMAVASPVATVAVQCAIGNCSKAAVAMAMVPGVFGGVSRRAIRIIEEVGGAIHLEIQTVKGSYQVIANISWEGDTLILSGAHMQGSGAGQFGGRELLKEIREAAKQFGREHGAKEVVIQGGARTSGANPGHIPPPIRVSTQ